MIAALYEDEEILVLDKPSGLASQPGEGIKVSLVEAVERDFGFRPFLVHRLDKETSGCIVVAKSAQAAARWSRLIESRELRKSYRALVSGRPEGESGTFSDDLRTRSGEKLASTGWAPHRELRRRGCLGSPADPRSRPERRLLLPRARAGHRPHAPNSPSTWPATACPSSATIATGTSPSISACAARRG